MSRKLTKLHVICLIAGFAFVPYQAMAANCDSISGSYPTTGELNRALAGGALDCRQPNPPSGTVAILCTCTSGGLSGAQGVVVGQPGKNAEYIARQCMGVQEAINNGACAVVVQELEPPQAIFKGLHR